ncbi:MAG: B12-binding domain-containing protein, partial [Promethearchaeota archaeon]
LREIGRRYEEGTFFVTHLVAAAEAARSAIDEVLTPALSHTSASEPRVERPRVVLATVQGDIHDIGKNIVGAMLFAAGFEVIDLGKDVSTEDIIAGVTKHKPALLGLSSLLSTTMPQIPKVLKALEEANLRNSIKVMVGGGAVTAQWAQDIGADGYGANATEAVTLAKQLFGQS